MERILPVKEFSFRKRSMHRVYDFVGIRHALELNDLIRQTGNDVLAKPDMQRDILVDTQNILMQSLVKNLGFLQDKTNSKVPRHMTEWELDFCVKTVTSDTLSQQKDFRPVIVVDCDTDRPVQDLQKKLVNHQNDWPPLILLQNFSKDILDRVDPNGIIDSLLTTLPTQTSIAFEGTGRPGIGKPNITDRAQSSWLVQEIADGKINQDVFQVIPTR